MITGIYALYWAEQDLIYIGQSNRLENRHKEHLYKLNKNTHDNYKVQNTYNKYGLPEFIILEYCTPNKLNYLEEVWTKEFNSLNSNEGLNIVYPGQMTGIYSSNSIYNYRRILRVFSLLYRTTKTYKEIAITTNTNINLVGVIARGTSHSWLVEKYSEKFNIIKENRVFTKANTIRTNQKLVTIISPEGIIYRDIYNIRKFCRENDILKKYSNARDSLSKTINGKYSNYKGWTGFIQ